MIRYEGPRQRVHKDSNLLCAWRDHAQRSYLSPDGACTKVLKQFFYTEGIKIFLVASIWKTK